MVGYAQRTLIAHNQIDHVPYAGISMGWGGWPDKIHLPGVANFSRENVVAQNLIYDLTYRWLRRLIDGRARRWPDRSGTRAGHRRESRRPVCASL